MGLEFLTLGAAKKNVKKTADSLGSLKGAPCTIKSQTETDDSYIVTFEWTGTSGATETSQLVIKKPKDGVDGVTPVKGVDYFDGTNGQDGVGISRIEKISTVGLVDTYRITFSDNTTFDYEVTNGADGTGGTGSGDENVIESIKINGVEQTVADDKSVDITVPANVQADWNQTDNTKDDYIKNKPTIPAEQVQSDWSQADDTAKDYIKNKPTIPDAQVQSDWNEKDNTSKAYIQNKPTIPSKVSDLSDSSSYATTQYVSEQIAGAGHLTRSIVATLPTDADAKDNVVYMIKDETVTGNDKYNEYMLIGGTVQQIGSTSVDLSDYAKSTDLHSHSNQSVLDGITSTKVSAWDSAEANVQSDWNVTDNTSDAFILNKPTSLPASDVHDWAKAETKPSYTAEEVGLGNVGNFKAVSTAAEQGLTDTEKSNARTNIGAGTSSFSGSYSDLSDKPTIPENVQSNWNETDTTSDAYIQNKPTIPSSTSELTNDSGFLTEHQSLTDYAKSSELHSHENKTTLDKLTENSNGVLLFNNEEIKGGSGKSAYEIAQDNGYVGTEAEWLESLKGVPGASGADGRSIISIINDENNNIIVTFSDNTTQNIGRLNVGVQADFLTSSGFGNLRYYNGHFQYYDTSTSSWIDTSITPENVYVINMIPQPMTRIMGIYDVELGKYKLKWKEPEDTIINGQVACVVEKVIIRRKLGSIPESETDGDLVTIVKRADFGSFNNDYYVDNGLIPNAGDIYYYKAFPVSTTGFVNMSVLNETSGILCKNYYLYGFKVDQNESDPASMIAYIEDNVLFKPAYMNYTTDVFDYGDWAETWFIKDLKPCMLKYDGTVDYELDKNDYTKKIDGTDSGVANTSYEGNAMIGFPKVYWKIVDNGDNTANIYISNKQADSDYHCWSHIDNNGSEIDYCYMPIYNGAEISSRLRSISGLYPMDSQTADTEIDYAKANNTGSDIIWYTELFNDRMLINLLLLLIGKSTDTQTIFGTGNNNSYVDGSNTGVINTGTMNTKGLFWGSQDNVSGVKVFGMENWYGNMWRRIGGWINDNGTQKIKMTYGKSDGSIVNGYNIDGSGYIIINNATPSGTNSGYISKMLITDNGLIPIISSGSASTYYCDGLWFNNSQINYALVGGDSCNASRVGALCSDLDIASSAAFWGLGAALSCKPLA